VPPPKIRHVLGISKAYTTRVGGGPFPTEMPDLEAKEVRERGKEFGAVTGRPRRCGWLDLAELRYAKMINGIDSLAVTKLDVFDTQREIRVGIGYTYKGTPIHEMPASAEEYDRVTPVYKTLPGWCANTYGVTDSGQLPKAALEYLRFVSEFLQVEIGMISTGPERDATIVPTGTLLAQWL
jgi:adenylosuccinate synthase